MSIFCYFLQTLNTWPYLQPTWHCHKLVEKTGLLICTNFIVPVCCYFNVLSEKICESNIWLVFLIFLEFNKVLSTEG